MRNMFEYCDSDRRRANRAQSSAPLHSAVVAAQARAAGDAGAFAAQMDAQRRMVSNFPRVG